MTACPRCGRENRHGAVFCDVCGTRLVPVGMTREERKIVTVLYADLVGFTARSEQLDPEDVRDVQDAYWQYVRLEIERHGGTVEKFVGDAVVALFGAPQAHEDDPERAVRAALWIRDWARDEDGLEVRIGITTGEALVRLGAQPLAGEGMASGDVMNTASRVEAAAPPNAILVGEATYRATRQVIEYREAEPLRVKGKTAPILVWEAVEARSRFGADIAHHAGAPLVGRERELDALADALARVREGSSPQLVTLVGVPGIGKSRLVYELMQRVRSDPSALITWRQGRSLPYGDGVSAWALGEIVKSHAGILETDSDEETEAKLRRVVRELVDDEEAGWVEAHLRPLVGLAPDDEDAAMQHREEAFAAWRRFFEELASRRPLVLVFEDLHWADDVLLDFLDHLVEWASAVPLLVVATARQELLERRPGWGGGKLNAATLTLPPLDKAKTSELLTSLLGDTAGDVDAELVARTGGNPLYADQYARMLSDQGERARPSLPESVHGIIAARLDLLPSGEKSLLQDAAVVGKVFWLGALVDRRSRSDVEQQLHALELKGFVQRAQRSSVTREPEYAFAHVLVRDVAYGQIPRAARANRHRAAAEWFESLGRPDDQAEMLAHHYSAALELATVAGSADADLADRARRALADAGDRASSLNAYAAAAVFYERALALTPGDESHRSELLFRRAEALYRTGDERREQALEKAREESLGAGDNETAAVAEALLSDVWWGRGQLEVSLEHLDRALELVRNAGPSSAKARVLTQGAQSRLAADEYSDAITLAEEALAIARAHGLKHIEAEALVHRGSAKYSSGDEGGLRDIERGLELALEANHLPTVARAYLRLSGGYVAPDEPRALELLSAAEELYKRLGDATGVRQVRANRVNRLASTGRWDEALELADNLIAECEAGSPQRSEWVLRYWRARMRFARGDSRGALDDLERGVAVERAAGHERFNLGVAARLYAELGRIEEARALGREFLAASPTEPTAWPLDFVLVAGELGFAEALERPAKLLAKMPPGRGGWAAAKLAVIEGRLAAAADIAAAAGNLSYAAELRLAAAKSFIQEERRAEASEQLEQALPVFRSVGATKYLQQAEALIGAIAPAALK